MNLTLRLTLCLCLAVLVSSRAATFTVTNTLNSGPGSLRQAIEDANANPGPDVIDFNIAPAGPQSIPLNGDLPTITGTVTLDATTQPGYGGTPIVELTTVPTQSYYGLRLLSHGNVVRGLILNRFQWYGIYLEPGSSGNLITGNWIGLDSTGSQGRGMNGNGITINGGTNNVIGGTTPQARNVISGNTMYGVAILGGQFNTVQGNYIGTDAAGTNGLGNGYSFSGQGNWAAGVWIEAGNTNTIGGAVAGAGNLISGNVRGLVLLNNSRGNLVQGNRVGTVETGTARLPGRSQVTGVYVLADSNVIGGTNALARNVISGNGDPAQGTEGNGVYLRACTGNLVQGNYIGTDLTGTYSVSNRTDGICLEYGANGNTIGGTGAGARNVLSGHGNGVGVRLWQCNSNVVQGNYIGTGADGVSPLGNATGVHVYAGNGNSIGGNSSAAGNVIAFNGQPGSGGYGVYVSSIAPDTSTNNLIRRNSLFGNAGLGIRLFNISCLECVPYNDAGDADTGPNDLLNFPVITNALVSPGSLNLGGTFNSRPGISVTVDFYASPDLDPSGFGEGRTWIGSIPLTTDGSGNAAFNAFFTDAGFAGQFVTATATDLSRNTSEFSAALATGNAGGTLVIAEAAYSVSEQGGSVILTVNRLGGSTGTVTVDYTTGDGSALAGSDYTSTAGVLTFAEGETARSFNVPVTNDTLNEPAETFGVLLGATTGGALLGSRTNVTVTIVDNDPVYVSAGPAAVTKPAAGSTVILLPITLNGPAGMTGSVAFATGNLTAEAGIDYIGTNGVAVFAPGVTNLLIPVTVLADGLQEGAKAFAFTLSNPTNLLVGTAQALGTFYDGTQGVLQFSQANYITSEDGGLVTLQVTRVGGTLGTVSASFSATAGSATPGADFVATNGAVTLNNGQAQASFQVRINDDSDPESAETILLQLANPAGTSFGSPSGAILTVQDNDYPSLAIQVIGGAVEVSWPVQAASLQLMSTPALGAGWNPVTNTPVQAGDKLVVTNTGTGPAQFYRLQQ